MIKSFIAGCALALALPTLANATTYVGTRTVGTASITLSVTTTPGATGPLLSSDILGYSINVTSPDTPFGLTPANSTLYSVLDGALFATADKLFFNFSASSPSGTPNYLLFYENQPVNPIDIQHFYCIQTSYGCNIRGQESESISSSVAEIGLFSQDSSGVSVLGFASEASSAVPEPGTWVMLILGFGLIGFAMRKHSNVRATVSYA